MASHSSRKLSSKREDRRLDHKKSRQATRQVLEGGYHHTVHGANWSTRVPQPPIDGDNPPRTSSKVKKGKCKRNKNGDHVPVRRKPLLQGYRENSEGHLIPFYGFRYQALYVCDKCGKDLWRHRTQQSPLVSPSDAHWTTNNIIRRLHLGQDACECETCKYRKETDE